MVRPEPRPHEDVIPRSIRILIGGIAGMSATICSHPFDMMKVHRQLLKASSSRELLLKLSKNPLNLYSGLSAGLLRQATYTSTRLGVYTSLIEDYKEKYKTSPSLGAMISIGTCAGASGALVGAPAEVVLIRMMADGTKPPDKRRYRHAFHALYEIRKHEGLKGLWRGGLTSVTRSGVISVVQIGTYVKTYEEFKERTTIRGYTLHFCAGTISSIATGFFSLPIDNIKTIYQEREEFKTSREVLTHILKSRGMIGLYQGFIPYVSRLTIHTSLAFFALEHFQRIYLELCES